MGNFESGVCCEYCNKLLRGLFYQGYSCLSCHRVMHRDCISLLPKCAGPSSLSQKTANNPDLKSDAKSSDFKSGLFAVCCDKLDGPAHFGRREIQSRCMTRWQDKHEYPW